MAEQPQISRPTPRRTFDLGPVSAEPSIPPSPENGNAELLDVKNEASYPPNKTRSILNLTSSTLLGIYSPTGYEASRDGTVTPWGTGTQTPSYRQSMDDYVPPPMNIKWDTAPPKVFQDNRRGTIRGYYIPLLLRGLMLFAFGTAYGTIITHLHESQDLTPIKVRGMDRTSWYYLVFWGISGVAMGSLLPWVDIIWEDHVNTIQPPATQNRHRRASSSASDGREDERPSGRFNNGLGADWNPVVRSVGAFVGIAFAIRKLPWQSTLQVSLTLALANPVLWYLVDRSKPGFILSSLVGVAGSLVLFGINPDMVPSPAIPSSRVAATNGSWHEAASSQFLSNEAIAVWTWVASVLFCSCVCFGNIGRRLALGKPTRTVFT